MPRFQVHSRRDSTNEARLQREIANRRTIARRVVLQRCVENPHFEITIIKLFYILYIVFLIHTMSRLQMMLLCCYAFFLRTLVEPE